MGFETYTPPTEQSETEKKQPEALKKVKEKLRILLTAGIILMGPGSIAFDYLSKQSEESQKQDFIEYIDRDKKMTDVEKKELSGDLDELSDKFSLRILKHLEDGDKMAIESRKDNKREAITIEGFDKLGLDPDKLKELWSEDNYPRGTIKEQIGSIKYSTGRKDLKGYNINGEAVETVESFVDQVNFHGTGDASAEKPVENLDWHFSHGWGHINDWINANDLSPAERVEFLHEVTGAFEQEGSFRDLLGYVDSINDKDKQKERYHKVTEYWASLCEYYFTFPELYDNLPEGEKPIISARERSLVEKWAKRHDQKFNPREAKEKRSQLIASIQNK